MPPAVRSHAVIYDINNKTGLPSLGKRLDEYVEKYLTVYYSKALETPMAIHVEELVKENGSQIKEEQLSENSDVFACCVLVDGDVSIYDPATGGHTPRFYPAGTIIVDPTSEWSMGEGARRNALMHEILHWEKDHAIFEIHHARLANTGVRLEPMKSRVFTTVFTPSEKSRRKETELQSLE